MNPNDLAKYGATYTPPTTNATSNPYQADASKYGATYTPVAPAPSSSVAKDWLGIQNPDTYFQDALTQFSNTIMHPVKAVENTVGAAVDAVVNPVKGAITANKTVASDFTTDTSAVKKTADLLHSIGSDAAVIFSPISAAFAAASQLPVLKEAADVLQSPFAVTGKIGDFAAESFIKALPIDQSSKDILAPAFGEIGSLAGQIFLGGRIIGMVAKGVVPDKVAIAEAVADTKSKVAMAEQHAQSPEMEATKYGATYTAPEGKVEPVSPTISTDTVSTPDSSLAEEARKYKSVDDFAKATHTVPIDSVVPSMGEHRISPGESRTPNAPVVIDFPTENEIAQGQNKPVIVDGMHRYYAALKRGDSTIRVILDDKLLGEGVVNAENKAHIRKPLTDFYNKTTKETPSGLGKSIEAKAVEAGLGKLEGVAGYDKSSIAEQAKIFSDSLKEKGIEGIREILRGEKPLPEGQKSFPFIVAMEDYLKKNPSAELAHEIANSPHVTAASEAGSQLGLGQNRIQDSFTKKVEEIKKARQSKTKEGNKASLVKRSNGEMTKNNLAPEDLGKLEKFIDNNLC